MVDWNTADQRIPTTTTRFPQLTSDLNLDLIFARVPTLSSRESEIFYLLADGPSNRAISTQLRITERTVKAHVQRIVSKLDIESKLQAGIVAFAWRMHAKAVDNYVPPRRDPTS